MDGTRNSIFVRIREPRDLQPLIPMTMDASDSGTTTGRGSGNGNRSHAGNTVRSNANSLVSSGALNSKPVLAFLAGFRITQILVGCWALLQGKEIGSCADLFYLRLWLFGYIVRCVALLYILWHRYKLSQANEQHRRPRRVRTRRPDSPTSPPGSARSNSSAGQRQRDPTREEDELTQFRIERLSFLMDVFYAVWFVVGNIWVHTVEPCTNQDQVLYTVCTVYLLLGFVGFIMPLLMCIAICCCLPCAIVAITMLGSGLQDNMGAPREVIEQLPEYKFENGKLNGKGIPQSEATCSICLEEFEEGSMVRELPCGHLFHSGCVDKWLSLNPTCPLCREGILEDEEEGEEGCESGESGEPLPV